MAILVACTFVPQDQLVLRMVAVLFLLKHGAQAVAYGFSIITLSNLPYPVCSLFYFGNLWPSWVHCSSRTRKNWALHGTNLRGIKVTDLDICITISYICFFYFWLAFAEKVLLYRSTHISLWKLRDAHSYSGSAHGGGVTIESIYVDEFPVGTFFYLRHWGSASIVAANRGVCLSIRAWFCSFSIQLSMAQTMLMQYDTLTGLSCVWLFFGYLFSRLSFHSMNPLIMIVSMRLHLFLYGFGHLS